MNHLKYINIIAWHELRRLFASPLAWVLLALTLLFNNFFIFNAIDTVFLQASTQFGAKVSVTETVIIPALGGLIGLLFMTMIVPPILSMRLFSDERRTGSLKLLLSSPASLFALVLGKYFGLMLFFIVTLGACLVLPLVMTAYANLDWWWLSAVCLGIILQTGAVTAICVFMSSLTQHAAIAAISSFAVILAFILIGTLGIGENFWSPMCKWLAINTHFSNFSIGQFSSADMTYYVMISLVFLWLTVQKLDWERT